MDRTLIRNYHKDFFREIKSRTFSPACLATYFTLDYENSVLDDEYLQNGSYELIGEYSGLVWKKILYLPLFQVEKMDVEYTEDESGYKKSNMTSSFWIPSEYGIQPSDFDFIFFNQDEIQSQTYNDNTFRVTSIKKNWNAMITYWNITIGSTYITKKQLNTQINEVLSFVDYEENIYNVDKALLMYKILEKNLNMNFNQSYDQRIGYYLEQI